MSLQTFFTAASATVFPSFGFGTGGGSTAQMLSQLLWNTAAGTLMAVFRLDSIDYDNNVIATQSFRIQIQKMWRDGQLLTLGCAVPEMGFAGSPFVAGTNDGRVARFFASASIANFSEEFWAIQTVLSGDQPNAYYAVDPLWPGDIICPGRLISSDVLAPHRTGLLLPATSTAYALVTADSGGIFRVYKRTASDASGTVVVSVIQTGDWNHPRDMLYIDTSTVAIVFRPEGGVEPNNASAATLKVFDTSGSAWVLKWKDTLPATDQVAAYDTVNGVLYSIGKRASNAILHASLLRRAPASVASASIVGTGTAFAELTTTQLSTIVQDGLGSVMSNTLVQWTLDAAISQGALNSAYSKTNNSGIATIVYTGPFAPSGLTERVNTTVATVEAV